MEPKIEEKLSKLAIDSVPNGTAYYDILTEYIRTKYGYPELTEEFMSDISNKITQITDGILSYKINSLYYKKIYVTCGKDFYINDSEKELHIEVRWKDNIDEPYIDSHRAWLVVPIGLKESLSKIRYRGIIDNNIKELTKAIDRDIVNMLRKERLKYGKYRIF